MIHKKRLLTSILMLCIFSLSVGAEVIKSEIVYAKLSAAGEPEQVFVVNAFELDEPAEAMDYGILLSQRYLEGRKTLPKREAAAFAFTVSAGSILTSASILTIAGFALGIVLHENGIISQMGLIIGRGAAISGFMVMIVLPQTLIWFDTLISKTTIRKRGKKS